MSLQLEDLSIQDQDEIRRILSLGELVAKDEEIAHIHARREYLSESLLSAFVPRFHELDLFGYPKPIEVEAVLEEVAEVVEPVSKKKKK